ncbi:MAG: Eco57I restriction-modification methylase domain-containing protein [Bacteroidales bacterium]
MSEKELKKLLRENYHHEVWMDLLRAFFPNADFFAEPEYLNINKAGINECKQIGSILLDDDKRLAVFDVDVSDDIDIARNRRGLREIAAKYIDQNILNGALAFYHNDKQSDYRFSFISKESKIDMDTGELLTDETKPKRFTYLFGDSQAQTTPARQLLMLKAKKEDGNEITIKTVKEAFNLEALNKEFYKDYQEQSKKIIRYIHPAQIENRLNAHQAALNLINRLMFVYFLEKKGWLIHDPHFLYNFWQDYKRYGKQENSFHKTWLNNVFFKAFNGKAYNTPEIFKELPEKYHAALVKFPYLNGGLFTFHADFDDFTLPDDYFESLFDFLQKYNFTIVEDSQEEVSMEINPELLGKMYEGMINATDLDDVDAEHGIVYTERPEINFMTRRSMVEVLDKKLDDDYSRDFLYHFCFDEPDAKLDLLKRYKPDANSLKNAVLSLTAIDPACGSGSMLIGLIHLQVELVKCIHDYMENPLDARDEFHLKKQIISDSIYGVDVKEWAVRIAELRFWLYMISEAEFEPEELTKEPLLPNLDFKLRQGNSLLQEFGNLDFSVKGLLEGRNKNKGAARKLNDFIKKKKAFITNQQEQENSYEALKREEYLVFREFIMELIRENKRQIWQLSEGDGQQSMFGHQSENSMFEAQKNRLAEDNQKLEKLLDSLKNTGRLPFSFDIDFMEIFITKDDPGFDLVIGNPPYVRQEDILPADDPLELERLFKPENRNEKTKLSKQYKQKLSDKVFSLYPFLNTKAKTKIDGKTKTISVYGNKVPGRSDLYVYFQLICPSLLNKNGSFCFIISNSWLDVGYGSFVQQFLLKHTDLQAIYDSSLRSFEASVNTIIYLHSAIKNTSLTGIDHKTLQPGKHPIRFVLNKTSYENAAYAPLLLEQEHCSENTFMPHYRVIKKTHKALWDEGYDEETHEYKGDKWGGKYLRAPEIFFTILEKGKDKLVPLKEIADVRFGIKTGANEFFILTRQKADEWGIEDEYLVPILKSPRQVQTIVIDPAKIPTLLFYCHKSKEELQGTNALKYIEWGEESHIENGEEKRAFHLRPSTRNRQRWWDVGVREISQLSFACGIRETYKVFKNEKVFIDKRLYEIYTPKVDHLTTYLNTTLAFYIIEITSRNYGGGGGPIDATVYELKNLQSINTLNTIKLIERQIHDIFTELGFDRSRPIRKQQPNPLPDRKELDDIIFDELGLTREERKEVYYSTAELVKQRLDKAGSRKK